MIVSLSSKVKEIKLSMFIVYNTYQTQDAIPAFRAWGLEKAAELLFAERFIVI